MLTILTIGAQIILISGMTPPSPLEWAVLFYGIIFHMLELIVWYLSQDLASLRWANSLKVKRPYFCGKVLLPSYIDIFYSFWTFYPFVRLRSVQFHNLSALSPDFLRKNYYIHRWLRKGCKKRAKDVEKGRILKVVTFPVSVGRVTSPTQPRTLTPRISTREISSI